MFCFSAKCLHHPGAPVFHDAYKVQMLSAFNMWNKTINDGPWCNIYVSPCCLIESHGSFVLLLMIGLVLLQEKGHRFYRIPQHSCKYLWLIKLLKHSSKWNILLCSFYHNEIKDFGQGDLRRQLLYCDNNYYMQWSLDQAEYDYYEE